MKWLALAGLLLAANAVAEEWNTSWDGALYGYATHTAPRNDSLLNPGNQLARIPYNSNTTEARFNFIAEQENLRFTARPIVLHQNNSLNNQKDTYLSLWQLRLRAEDNWSIAAGREVLNWGPAQFRSPSSPFYFDNGRSNPMRELSGVDALKVSWNPDMQRTLTIAHLTGSGHLAQDLWRNSDLLKADQRGDDWAGGLALAQTPGQGIFAGLHGQYSANDAWLLYGEAASSTRAHSLQSPADPNLPYSILPRSARQTVMLAGISWTFDNGQALNAEYLHDGHGYSPAEQTAYYRRASTSPAGMALQFAPPLLGRDYLHLVWQSNLMESGGYWRMMATHSFSDHGNELSGYSEFSLNRQVTVFMLGALPAGGTQQEFSSLLRYSVTAGIKVALP